MYFEYYISGNALLSIIFSTREGTSIPLGKKLLAHLQGTIYIANNENNI